MVQQKTWAIVFELVRHLGPPERIELFLDHHRIIERILVRPFLAIDLLHRPGRINPHDIEWTGAGKCGPGDRMLSFGFRLRACQREHRIRRSGLAVGFDLSLKLLAPRPAQLDELARPRRLPLADAKLFRARRPLRAAGTMRTAFNAATSALDDLPARALGLAVPRQLVADLGLRLDP